MSRHSVDLPAGPSWRQRAESCRRPAGAHVMYQCWRSLLFLHWEVDPAIVQRSLPDGLMVDTFEGRAYLGIVPFFMQGVRPRFFPALPYLSRFPEINLRTYVYDHRGEPGVWFYSLDVPQAIAVWLARRFFYLPYFRARIEAGADRDGWRRYRSLRKSLAEANEPFFRYRSGRELGTAAPGSFEFFLVERYRLFSAGPDGRLYQGRVYHTPYPLRLVEVDQWCETLFELSGFARPGRPPEHAIFSDGVDVQIFAIDSVPDPARPAHPLQGP